jgi:hypothetical protein
VSKYGNIMAVIWALLTCVDWSVVNCDALEGVGMASHGEGHFVGKRSVQRIT